MNLAFSKNNSVTLKVILAVCAICYLFVFNDNVFATNDSPPVVLKAKAYCFECFDPTNCFSSTNEIVSFAANNSRPPGWVTQMKVGEEDIWVMQRSMTYGAASAEIVFFRKKEGKYVLFYMVPMCFKSLKVEQVGNSVMLSKYDDARNSFVKIVQFFELP